MVEQIKEFRPELYSHLLADIRPLEHGEIKVVNSGIKPLGDAAAASVFIASRDPTSM
jgi:hypothetical protein